ncbi:HNH endonuclease [Shewanella electrodiphila]|uniref:HNH endonuclease n=1 Tax=Shewanella electrodiphila TaxID=934143 RepID=A0ABT0KUJ7_9GAMM|nr:HNH endonuclease [Shewanella electrodiphila]MCL1047520.1 HNH endonuclease [Shewanella electrodiphila]
MKKLVIDRIVDNEKYQLQSCVCSERISWRPVYNFSNLQQAIFGNDGAYSLLYDYSGLRIEAQRDEYGEPFYCGIWIKDLEVDIDEALLISEDRIALVSRDDLARIEKVSVDGYKHWPLADKAFHQQTADEIRLKLSAIFEKSSKKIPFPEPDSEGKRFIKSLKGTVEQRDIITELSNDLNQADSASETEKEAVLKSRVGQGRFRKQLIQYWNKCAVTGCETHSLLRASHIKPWADSDNKERLDVHNGLLLTPGLDTAFDLGLITFQVNGEMLISDKISEDDLYYLGIFPNKRNVEGLKAEHEKYLLYHYEYVFERWLK